MADPLLEEGTDGAPSHFAFSGVVEADVDCPGFTYAELGASEGEYSSAPVEVYIPRPVEEPPIGTTSFGEPIFSSSYIVFHDIFLFMTNPPPLLYLLLKGAEFCDQLFGWGTTDSYSVSGANFSIPSWGISMSPFLDFPAQSAFQVGDTTSGGGGLHQADSTYVPPTFPYDGEQFYATSPYFPSSFQDPHPGPSNLAQASESEAEEEGEIPAPVQQERWMNFITDVWNRVYTRQVEMTWAQRFEALESDAEADDPQLCLANNFFLAADFFSGADIVPNLDEENSPPLEVGAPPEHGIRWPEGTQPAPHFADDGCWEFLVGRITALADSTDPAPIEVIREALEQHTGSAFSMGVQQERWMNFITDAAEVRKRQKTRELRMARLERELGEAISCQAQDARDEAEGPEEGGLRARDRNGSRRPGSSKARKAERLQKKAPSWLWNSCSGA
ncbi:hypothetical protein Taro_015276 [Colocasia esculenta]|uniref:Uncharacterized protein n=1 Tax=Colocasia esculenta TaxID=4460 RepID=A0A843UKE8_COLES|nr:hypothetical protein [Colocasia esculenta]